MRRSANYFSISLRIAEELNSGEQSAKRKTKIPDVTMTRKWMTSVSKESGSHHCLPTAPWSASWSSSTTATAGSWWRATTPLLLMVMIIMMMVLLLLLRSILASSSTSSLPRWHGIVAWWWRASRPPYRQSLPALQKGTVPYKMCHFSKYISCL